LNKTYIAKQPSQTAGLEKIIVTLGEKPWHGFAEETLWVKKVNDNLYQLQNTPFFAKGLAYLDIVSAKTENGRLMFSGVSDTSRRSTYRVHLKAATPAPSVQPLFNQLTALGCTYESYVETLWTLFAWDVPASAIDAAYKILDTGEKQELWAFEEGHYGGREH
jgi:Domain of unknown function (DUF4265)